MRFAWLGICILSIISLSPLKAASVSFGVNPTSRSIASEAGVNFAGAGSGSYWIGTFSNEIVIETMVDHFLPVAVNVATIIDAAGWEQFTMDTVDSSLNSAASSTLDFVPLSGAARLGGTATDNTSGATKADFFNGKQIYIWIFNADMLSSATEMGIFEATAATVPWIFPVNEGGLGDALTLSTSTGGATIAAVGGVGSISDSQIRTEAFGLTVPEPTRILLLGFGAACLALHRRRCRQRFLMIF